MSSVPTDESRPELQLVAKGGGPDVMTLMRLYNQVTEDLTDRVEVDACSYESRHTIWPGQTADQRKHASAPGDNQPFPWDGASDLKVPVVDELINHGVALDCTALARANIRAVAIEGGDIAKAGVVSNFMRWLVLSQMTELPKESEILANYRRERGIGILGIFWEDRIQKTLQKLSVADMEPDLAASIQEGVFTEELVGLVVDAFGVSKKKANRMIEDLRDTGETTVPVAILQSNRPVVKAYAIGEDIMLPPNTQDIQTARAIFRRQWMSPEQLREKVLSAGWDKDYVDYVIASCVGQQHEPGVATNDNNRRFLPERVGVNDFDINKGLVEIVYAYERLSDEDGVPGIYCTVFCPSAGQADGEDYGIGYAKHELLGYRHGQYPFIAFTRERLSRFLLDTRGVPEVGHGYQQAIKVELDARIDNASLSTCPPMRHPVGREPGRVGPGAKIGERRPQEFGYMETPPAPSASVEVQREIENKMRRYFGRPTQDDDTGEWQVKQQQEIRGWLESWSLAFRQVWSLWRQYGPKETTFQVIGSQSPGAIEFIQNDHSDAVDFYLSFDVLDMDPESWKAKMDALAVLIQQDKYGIIDNAAFIQAAAERVDPVLAERMVLPQQVAAQREVQDTQTDIAKMWSGVPVDVPENGINAPLRLQVLQTWLQGTPEYPASDVQARIEADGAFAARIENYGKQLKFRIDQQQNAVTGRIGNTPGGAPGTQSA